MRTTILAAAAAGGLFGVGLVVFWLGLVTPERSLRDFSDSLGTATMQQRRRFGPLGRWAAEAQRQFGRELELCEQSAERFVSTRMLLTVEFAAIPLLWLLFAGMGFVPMLGNAALMIIFAGAAGAVGWLIARLQLRAEADRRVEQFSTALASYTELVAVLVAGGAGIETATQQAVTVGDGPAFRHLSAAIAASVSRREPPWRTLRILGQRLGVEDLVDFGSSMELAADGSRIADAMTAKSLSIRERELSRELATAESRSETMVIPVAIMLIGVFLLIGFPITMALTTL